MIDYTVVIPAYNAAATIGATIESVMSQTIQPKRVVVVSDGSTDETADLVREKGGLVELIEQAQTGPGGATTRGLKTVTTEFVAMVDSDDLWLPRKTEMQAAVLADVAVTGVFCHVASFRGEPDAADHAGAVPGWFRTALLMRTEAALAVGPIIDPPGNRGDMVDWIARVREAGYRLEMMPDVLALRRIHPGSMTFSRSQSGMQGYLHVVRAAMLRRKQRTEGDSD